MIQGRCARSALVVLALLCARATTAHAQQVFEDKYAARQDDNEFVTLPVFGIAPTNGTLEANVAEQLTELIQRQLAAMHENRFEVVARSSGSRVIWALLVRNTPRSELDTFTSQIAGQLHTCLHSLQDDTPLTNLDHFLRGLPVESPSDVAEANAAGLQMLANWRADHCTTRRNDRQSLDTDEYRGQLLAATHGMITGAFDALLFNGQTLLNLIAAIKPLYFDQGGLWTTEMGLRLHAVFDAAVRGGLFSSNEITAIASTEQRTFWDWAVMVVISKPAIARSFLADTAAACVRTVAELSNAFQLSRCVSEGKVQIKLLRVAGQDFAAVQRVLP